jgi:hypothetical protein
MVEGQIFCGLVIPAILTPIPVTDIDPNPFHGVLASLTANVYIIAKPYDAGNLVSNGGRPQYIIAIGFLYIQFFANLHADCPCDTNRAQGLVRKVQ